MKWMDDLDERINPQACLVSYNLGWARDMHALLAEICDEICPDAPAPHCAAPFGCLSVSWEDLEHKRSLCLTLFGNGETTADLRRDRHTHSIRNAIGSELRALARAYLLNHSP